MIGKILQRSRILTIFAAGRTAALSDCGIPQASSQLMPPVRLTAYPQAAIQDQPIT